MDEDSGSGSRVPPALPQTWRQTLSCGFAPLSSAFSNSGRSIEPILRQEGVPSELSAIVLVESGGQPAALSPKGARGLWQFDAGHRAPLRSGGYSRP